MLEALRCGQRRFLLTLDEIPFVAVEVAEYCDCAVRFLARLFYKRDAAGSHVMIVAPEIACFEEESNAIAGLVADVICLVGRGCFGE